MTGAALVWAACPSCDQTWSEEAPDLGFRTAGLVEVIQNDLAALAYECREGHGTRVQVGIVLETPP